MRIQVKILTRNCQHTKTLTIKNDNQKPNHPVNSSKFLNNFGSELLSLDIWRIYLFFFFLIGKFFCSHWDLNLKPPTNPPRPFTTWASPQGHIWRIYYIKRQIFNLKYWPTLVKLDYWYFTSLMLSNGSDMEKQYPKEDNS